MSSRVTASQHVRGLATFVAGLLFGLTAFAQQPTFRSDVASVMLEVSVKRDGKPAVGLTASDFRLTDRGVLQTIVDVSREQLRMDVTFVPDLVGAVEGPWLEGFRRAFETMRRNLREGDRARLLLFDPRIQDVTGIERSSVEFKGETRAVGGGASSLFDAVSMSLIRDADPNYRRMAIVMSDGEDGDSFLDEREMLEVAARTDVTVFVIALTDGTTRVPQRPANERMLQALADSTGGTLTVVQRDADLAARFVHELEEFRTSYVLRYTPTGVRPSGWHDVDVRLNRSGRFQVRARKGYFGDRGADSR
jgi:VWFA-related protein